MTWPTGDVNTTHLDSDLDSPALARVDLLALVQKFNQLRAHPSADGKSLIGAADFAAMRTLLGLVIGTNVQAQDAQLQALADLTPEANRLPYFTGASAAALATFTAAARQLLDDPDVSTMLSTLGVSNFIKTMLDDADAAAARATLGAAAQADLVALDGRLDTAEADITALDGSRKPTVLDHGSKAANYEIDLSLAELHLVEFTAAATLTISSTLTNDRAAVVVKSNGHTITLAGIDNDSPTLTGAASTQDFLALVKSFGTITCVAAVLDKAAA